MNITVIVFCRYKDAADEIINCSYDGMPRGWGFIERRTSENRSSKYSHALFFQGPRSSLYPTLDYLDDYFGNLCELDFVKVYKIKQLG